MASCSCSSGPSGCGKTTILPLIAGLEEATSGDLWLDGQLVNNVPPQQRNIAMVFQHGALYPHLTVRENLAFPLETAGETDRAAIDRRVDEVARALDIDTELDPQAEHAVRWREPAGGDGPRAHPRPSRRSC